MRFQVNDAQLSSVIVLVLLLFAASVTGPAAMAAAAGDAGGAGNLEGTLVVSGRAELRVQPDMAFFQVGVETRGDTLADARRANAQAMTDVRARLIDSGADEAHLRTRGFSAYPEWHYNSDDGTRTLVGYRVVHTLEVTVPEIDWVAPWIDAAMEMGANQISGPTFGLKHPDELEMEALVQAVKKASAKAEVLAQAAGVQIKRVKHMNEAVSTPPGGAQRASMMMADAMYEAASTPIEPGEVSVSATVSITYVIE